MTIRVNTSARKAITIDKIQKIIQIKIEDNQLVIEQNRTDKDKDRYTKTWAEKEGME